MKLISIFILVLGLLLGAHALTMDVGVEVPAQDSAYGVSTPGMRVANIDLMNQRQNYLIFSGILALVGAILTGFASMRPSAPTTPFRQSGPSSVSDMAPRAKPSEQPSSVSICPQCRSMGPGDLTACTKCGTAI